jgi:hypothetical protein
MDEHDRAADEVAKDQPPKKDELLQSIIKPKCDLCGSLMLEWHCRMMCPMCGYQRDCSDP